MAPHESDYKQSQDEEFAFREGERLLDEALKHARQGQEEEARALYRKAIELHPGLLLEPELPPIPLGRKGITVTDVFRAIKRGR